ncbi:protein kinase domain-containing protein [Theileria equi strain WA]|uniref:Protein kinase domain-containing protein n=1 Tax=Theileria equi strain WA TaxID=1537102 RepID=L0B3G1_THEEQ|nr:protein kinase domain-containing protein [Theileria equi strain WA]AFZ81659.1 protein kinase domain-containing protein [Theileria equi strain WA]|eukprot:XP_004831325.1 protein kinase domain-containing protein [Theileria equi strain WA]
MSTMGIMGKLSREITAISGLYHPNIIQLYELIDTPDTLFIIMEYVDGGELFEYVSQKSRLREVEAIRLFRQILSAVDFCHRRMLCHRDLKPENILLDKCMNIKLGDFGLSNFMRDGECLKTPCGSPNYASPEVICGKPYSGPEVDIWSCGIILYVLLCGALPFDDDEMPVLFGKIKLGKFYIPGHITKDAKWLLLRMLDANPQTRITMEELMSHPWLKWYIVSPNLLEKKEIENAKKSIITIETTESLDQHFTMDPFNPHNIAVESSISNTFTLNKAPPRWNLGIIGVKPEDSCMYQVCQYLKENNYIWRFLPGYRLLCKHSEKEIFNFVIQLYKIRYKTYLIDVQLCSGVIFR